MYSTSNDYSMNDYLYFDGLSDYDIMIGALDKDDNDILDEGHTTKCIGKRKTGRAYRRSSGKRKSRKLKNIAAEFGRYNFNTMWLNWKCIDGEWVQEGSHLKYPNNSNKQKLLKRKTNKRVRKSVDISGKGNSYRRKLDYMWGMF